MDPSFIIVENCQSKYQVNEEKITTICQNILNLLQLPHYELSLQFVSPEDSQQLNRDFRGKDYPTDVLSFPQEDWPSPLVVSQNIKKKLSKKNTPPKTLGDLAICIDIAAENAQNIGQSVSREVCFLIVHGILHLCGHDHLIEEEEQIMIEQQKVIMDLLQDISSQPIWFECIEESEKN